jgi:hypothetical protein
MKALHESANVEAVELARRSRRAVTIFAWIAAWLDDAALRSGFRLRSALDA